MHIETCPCILAITLSVYCCTIFFQEVIKAGFPTAKCWQDSASIQCKLTAMHLVLLDLRCLLFIAHLQNFDFESQWWGVYTWFKVIFKTPCFMIIQLKFNVGNPFNGEPSIKSVIHTQYMSNVAFSFSVTEPSSILKYSTISVFSLVNKFLLDTRESKICSTQPRKMITGFSYEMTTCRHIK